MFQEIEGGGGGGHRLELKYIMHFVASASLAYSSCLILHSVCANWSAANLQPVISLQFDRVSYRIFCWGWEETCRSWKISIPNLKKSLSHCQGFIQDFELGEGGDFHALAKGGGGGEVF